MRAVDALWGAFASLVATIVRALASTRVTFLTGAIEALVPLALAAYVGATLRALRPGKPSSSKRQ